MRARSWVSCEAFGGRLIEDRAFFGFAGAGVSNVDMVDDWKEEPAGGARRVTGGFGAGRAAFQVELVWDHVEEEASPFWGLRVREIMSRHPPALASETRPMAREEPINILFLAPEREHT